jgi:hypothetical protein
MTRRPPRRHPNDLRTYVTWTSAEARGDWSAAAATRRIVVVRVAGESHVPFTPNRKVRVELVPPWSVTVSHDA